MEVVSHFSTQCYINTKTDFFSIGQRFSNHLSSGDNLHFDLSSESLENSKYLPWNY